MPKEPTRSTRTRWSWRSGVAALAAVTMAAACVVFVRLPERLVGSGPVASVPIDAADGAKPVLRARAPFDAVYALVVRPAGAASGADGGLSGTYRVEVLDRAGGAASESWRTFMTGSLHGGSDAIVFDAAYVGGAGLAKGTEFRVTLDVSSASDHGGRAFEVELFPAARQTIRARVERWSWPAAVVTGSLALVLGTAAAVMPLLANRRRERRRRAGACLACGHPLAGAARCPECGVTAAPELPANPDAAD